MQAFFLHARCVARRLSSSTLVIALTGGIALGSMPLHAAPPEEAADEAPVDTETKAMKAFEDGQAAYDRGEYKAALELFLEAQSLYPSPVFHYNIGRCYEALENYEQAITSYNAYLRSTKSSTGEDPADKTNIEKTIARLEKLLEAERAEDEAARNKEPVVIVKDAEEKEKKPGRGLIITGGVLTGVGAGVAIVGGAVFGIQARNASSDLDAIYEGGNPEGLTLADAEAIDARGKSAETNQIILVSVGSAIGVTGVALLVVGVLKAKKAKAKPSTEPSAQFLPTFGSGSAGFVLNGRF